MKIIESRIRFLAFRLRYFTTPEYPVLKKIIERGKEAGTFLEEPLNILIWASSKSKPELKEDMDKNQTYQVLRFYEANDISLDKAPPSLKLRDDTKLLALSLTNKDEEIQYELFDNKIAINKGDIKIEFPFIDSLGLIVDNYKSYFNIWMQIPYKSTLNIEDGLPLLPIYDQYSKLIL
ncbi:hypothetical protein MCHI_001596 [Candidatus Magnetoovum chiemensis]|nr:hypothetical protein MCHI_001596 [Candidatus Magnetoovum chiemensis]